MPFRWWLCLVKEISYEEAVEQYEAGGMVIYATKKSMWVYCKHIDGLVNQEQIYCKPKTKGKWTHHTDERLTQSNLKDWVL